MDIPISLLNWEIFLPEQYKVKDFGGDVIAANRVPPAFRADSVAYQYDESREAALAASKVSLGGLLPGQLGGVLADPSGAVLPNARITVTQPDNGFSMSTVTDQLGRWVVSNLRTGRVKITASAPGFQTAVRDAVYDASRGSAYSFALGLAAASETVEVARSRSRAARTRLLRTETTGEERAPAECLRQRGQPATPRCWRAAGPDRGAPHRHLVQLRPPSGTGRRNKGDVQLQKQVKKSSGQWTVVCVTFALHGFRFPS